MEDVMLASHPIDQRGQILKDSCDQIEEKDYTRRFSSAELVQKRKELADSAIQISNLENELSEIKEQYKQKMKPIQDSFSKVRDEIKAGGEYVKTECYKFIDNKEGKAAWYNPQGYKIEERDCTPEEKQRTIFQDMRNKKTGTDD